MEHIHIRQVGINDVDALQAISRKTFFETFAEVNTAENMAQYLEESFSVQRITAELTNPDSIFYFAESAGTVIGYLKLNFGESQTDVKDNKSLEIERIYVLNEFHGKQVGQILYEKAIEVARQSGADYVWLGVWEENPRAIRFYQKNGFVEFGKHVFKLGDDEQMDILMKLPLT